MRILILGSIGQLGTPLTERLLKEGHRVITPTHEELDLKRAEYVRAYIQFQRPEVLLNCAAIHDVSKCEQSPDLAIAINVGAVVAMHGACEEIGAKFFQVSTDYVVDVPGLVLEGDDINPHSQLSSIYARTKRAAEKLCTGRDTVVRVSTLYGHDPCRGKSRPNLVDQLHTKLSVGEELEMPMDIGCSPGYCVDVAEVLSRMISVTTPNIVHLAPRGLDGNYTLRDFAQDVSNVYGNYTEVKGKSSSNSSGVINLGTQYNWSLPNVVDSLRKYLEVKCG